MLSKFLNIRGLQTNYFSNFILGVFLHIKSNIIGTVVEFTYYERFRKINIC